MPPIVKRIWADYWDSLFKSYQIDLLLLKYQRLDRRVNVFLAIASSSSIGAWVVFQEYPEVWASIIAASQLITVLKPYFPYTKYVTELHEKSIQSKQLNLEFDLLWMHAVDISRTVPELTTRHQELKKTMNSIFHFSSEMLFTVSDKICAQANEKLAHFYRTHHNPA